MIFIAFKVSKRRTIRNFYKFDFIPITSGSKQNFVGGIITLLYCLTLMILISGVFVRRICITLLDEIFLLQQANWSNTVSCVWEYKANCSLLWNNNHALHFPIFGQEFWPLWADIGIIEPHLLPSLWLNENEDQMSLNSIWSYCQGFIQKGQGLNKHLWD